MTNAPTSFRLSPETKKILEKIAKSHGCSQTAVVVGLIRHYAVTLPEYKKWIKDKK